MLAPPARTAAPDLVDKGFGLPLVKLGAGGSLVLSP
jgi:hypothetical protein